MATVCCIHMYKRLVIESYGDSSLERERRRGLEWGKMQRISSPAKFPKGQFTVMDEYTVTVKFLTVWMCLCGRRQNAE